MIIDYRKTNRRYKVYLNGEPVQHARRCRTGVKGYVDVLEIRGGEYITRRSDGTVRTKRLKGRVSVTCISEPEWFSTLARRIAREMPPHRRKELRRFASKPNERAFATLKRLETLILRDGDVPAAVYHVWDENMREMQG